MENTNVIYKIVQVENGRFVHFKKQLLILLRYNDNFVYFYANQTRYNEVLKIPQSLGTSLNRGFTAYHKRRLLLTYQDRGRSVEETCSMDV